DRQRARLAAATRWADRVMQLAFILDPLDSLKTYKDSSFAMMREAAARGHRLHSLQQEDLAWRDGKVVGFASALAITSDAHAWYQSEDPVATPLEAFDA